ncbi:hypothetical protein D9M68_576760 [compost metagenome]
MFSCPALSVRSLAEVITPLLLNRPATRTLVLPPPVMRPALGRINSVALMLRSPRLVTRPMPL